MKENLKSWSGLFFKLCSGLFVKSRLDRLSALNKVIYATSDPRQH